MIDVRDYVVVTGPQSSGTRLVAHLLRDGGVSVWHDKSHGTSQLNADRVVVVVRDPLTTRMSRDGVFGVTDRIERRDSLIGCACYYPDALWVSYEQLCANPVTTIDVLAGWLGIEPWGLDCEVTEQNTKWRTGKGGSSLPELEPVL